MYRIPSVAHLSLKNLKSLDSLLSYKVSLELKLTGVAHSTSAKVVKMSSANNGGAGQEPATQPGNHRSHRSSMEIESRHDMKPEIEDESNPGSDDSAAENVTKKVARDPSMDRGKVPEGDPGPKPELNISTAAPAERIFNSDFRLSFASMSSDAKVIRNLLTMSPKEVKTVTWFRIGQEKAKLMSLRTRIGRRTFCLPNYEAIVKTTTIEEYYGAARSHYGESEIKRTRVETPAVIIFFRVKEDTSIAKDTVTANLGDLTSIRDKVGSNPSAPQPS